MADRRARAARSPSPVALKRGLSRLVTTVEQQIDRAIEHPSPPPEVLHDLHRELRRLAGGLSLWEELLPARSAADVKPIVRRIRRFARLVGRVRDRDVTLSLLEPLLGVRDRAAEARALRGFVGRLREDGRTGRELLRAFLTTERRGGLLDQSRSVLARVPRAGAGEEIVRIFRDEWQVHRQRVRKARRRARKHPDIDRLHRLRIRIRRWRHLASLADLANVPAPERVAPSLRTLQDRLGHLHDLDVALTSLPDELTRSAAARRLAETLRRQQALVRSHLEDPVARRRSVRARPRHVARRS